jgi:hypothetical protein
MAYSYATREEIARTPGLFADTVSGALNTHSLYRIRHLAVPAQQTQGDYDLATAILADNDLAIKPAMRMILHSAEQSQLEDVTSLTDQQVVTMIETLWPFLVAVVGE